MKIVIGLEKYRDYQRKIEQLKHECMALRSDNESDTVIKLIHNDEMKQKITKYFYLSVTTILILTGLISIYLKMIQKTKYILIVFPVLLVWGVLFIVLFEINKKKEQKIKKEKEKMNENELGKIEEFKNLQESLYKIVIYIITINEFYYDLCTVEKENLKDEWNKKYKRVEQIINQSIGYHICLSSYQQYFNEWLAKQEIYG